MDFVLISDLKILKSLGFEDIFSYIFEDSKILMYILGYEDTLLLIY